MDGAVKNKETKLENRKLKLDNNERNFNSVLEREVATKTATLKEHCEYKIKQAQDKSNSAIEENNRKLEEYKSSLDIRYSKLEEKNNAKLEEYINCNDSIIFNLMITMIFVVALCFLTFKPLRNIVKTYFIFQSFDADGISLFIFNLILFVSPLIYMFVKKYDDTVSYHVISIEFLIIAFFSNNYPDFNTGYLYCGILLFISYLVARRINNIEDEESRKRVIMNVATFIVVIAVFIFLFRLLGQAFLELTGS